MRALIFAAFLFPIIAAAQQVVPSQPAVKEGSNWQHVQALPPGASMHIKTTTGSVSCKFRSADADSLSCFRSKDLTLTRSEIRSIKVSHRGRSTLVGAAIGAGAGAGIVQATDKPDSWFHGLAVVSGAVLFGAIGAPIGALTDFTRSTVYRAP